MKGAITSYKAPDYSVIYVLGAKQKYTTRTNKTYKEVVSTDEIVLLHP